MLFYHAFTFLRLFFFSHGYWLACGVAHYRWCKVVETWRTVSFKSNYSRTPTFIWPRRNSYLTKYVLILLGCHSNNWRQEDIRPHDNKCRSRWKPVHAGLKLNWGKRECNQCKCKISFKKLSIKWCHLLQDDISLITLKKLRYNTSCKRTLYYIFPLCSLYSCTSWFFWIKYLRNLSLTLMSQFI